MHVTCNQEWEVYNKRQYEIVYQVSRYIEFYNWNQNRLAKAKVNAITAEIWKKNHTKTDQVLNR